MKSSFLFLVLLALLSAPFQAEALLFNQPLDFFASTQSLWGPGGGTVDFGDRESINVGIATLGYDIGASSGTVSARFPGTLSVDYSPSLTAPGTTSLNFSFLGNAGQLKSDLGAWVNVYADTFLGNIDIVDERYSLNIYKSYMPQIGQQVSGSDSATISKAGIDILIAEAGARFDIEQTDIFKATSIDGLLAYTLRGSGTNNYMPFTLITDAGLTMNLDLSDTGTWDFWLMDMDLNNQFATSYDAELVLYEKHISGIGWCGSWFPYPCPKYSRSETTLAGIDIYDPSPFSLNFNSISNISGFAINVGTASVPEPVTLLLLGSVLLGLIGFRRKFKK